MLSITILAALAAAVNAVSYDQKSVEQYELFRFLGGTGPYVSHRGFGISPKTPDSCEVVQAHVFMRHGERYPTKGTGSSEKKLYNRLKQANVTEYTGPLAFIKDYEWFVGPDSNFEKESYKGRYSGLADAYNYGTILREQYSHLYDGKTVQPIFSSSQQRVVDTAHAFGEGFFGLDYDTLGDLVVIPENATQGANTLTSHDACVNFDGDANDDIINEFDQSYLNVSAARLNKLSPGFNISADDVSTMLAYCGFELNVRGESKFCDIFEQDEWINFGYSKDLGYYYSNGPGYNLSIPLGSVYVNNTLTLMEDTSYPYNLTFSFSHDNDLMTFVTALGLFDDYLSPEYVDFHSVFHSSEIVPMGGRMVHEKLSCTVANKTDSFVRIVLNDAVIPIPGCQDGPGFSCSLAGYKDNYREMLGNQTYTQACGVNSTLPQYNTFYWDFNSTQVSQ